MDRRKFAFRARRQGSPPAPAPAPALPPAARLRLRPGWICLALLLVTFAVYSQVRHFDFVNFDDADYISSNPHVRNGITLEGIRWAFVSGDSANWFPLTRLSHMLDCQFFGLQSGWHHITNVFFHLGATWLLFAFLYRATRARWPSALVAFLFALHPLHVESVAWVAERKDVLSAFFWFLALWAYARYAERPGPGRYALVLAAFCGGLMAKPMIVTLPFVLLLLDVWPLRRTAAAGWGKILGEKIPLFALSAAAAATTYMVQAGSGAVRALGPVPIGLRLENVLVSYVVYAAAMFWPARLAVFYPYPPAVPVWEAALCGVAIAAVSVLVARRFRAYPYLAVGWAWYLGTLVPVIGLIQVGTQARADRYMYVPMVGLAIMVAWSAADLLVRYPRLRPAAIAVAAAACAILTAVTWVQIRYWENSRSLFQHAVEVTEGNYLAHQNLADELAKMPGHQPEAISHYQAALRIRPDYFDAHLHLGLALSNTPGELPEAIAHYRAALRIQPDSAVAHHDLGNALWKIPGGLPQAISEYQAALRLRPVYAEAHNSLGSALMEAPGRLPEAISHLEAALRMEPDYAAAHNNLGIALSQAGRLPEAITHLEVALRASPDSVEAHNNLGIALSQAGRFSEAIVEFEAALRLAPDYAEAHKNLGIALAEVPGRQADAVAHLEAALRMRPDPEIRQALERLRASR